LSVEVVGLDGYAMIFVLSCWSKSFLGCL